MRQLARWILSLLSLSAFCTGAQALNFDDVPDGTDISTHYPGFIFSCEGMDCASPSIFARQSLHPRSSPNVVAPEQTGAPGVHNPTTGVIKIALACQTATKVTVWAWSELVPEPLNNVQHAILVAKDSNGAILGQAVGTKLDQWEPLTVSSSNTPIKTVSLGVESDGKFAAAQFDDLTVECTPRIRPIWSGFPLIRYWPVWLATALIVGFVVVVIIRRRLKLPEPPGPR